MSQREIEQSNHRFIESLQSRIRTLEEELRITRLERDSWKGRQEALNILLSKEIEDLETKILTIKNK